MKFGIWLLIAAAAYLWFQYTRRLRLRQMAELVRAAERAGANTANQPGSQGHNRAAERPADQSGGEPMVACRQCGLYVPLSDAIPGERGAAFCSEAHRRLHHAA